MRILRINVPNQRKPVAQANGEHSVASLPTEPGKLRSFLLNPFRRRDLQSLNHSRDRFSPGKKHRDVHVIGNAADSHTNIFRTIQNGGQISMHLAPNSILQKRTPIFNTEHQMHENIREGLGHAGEYNARLQPANIFSFHTWGFAPGYNHAGLQPAPPAETVPQLNKNPELTRSIRHAGLQKQRAVLCAILAVCFLQPITAFAQPPHPLRIRIINAQTNKPIHDEHLNIALRVDQIGSVAMATDKNGIILIDTGEATTIRILANMYADCRPRAELYSDYSIDTIRHSGITTGNLCGGAQHTARPGELLLYEIPKTYIPTYPHPPVTSLPHSDENPHQPQEND